MTVGYRPVGCIIDINRIDAKDAVVRTTVTIDDDLAARIEELRRREGLSFREALDRLLRRALQADATPPRPRRRYRTTSRKLGLRAGLDAARLNQLVDELEVERFEASVRR